MWIIDFESSGLSRLSYPISVGVTNGETEFDALIRPMPNWNFWSEKAEQVHLIERNVLLDQGLGAEDVAQSLGTLLAGQKVYCDAIQWDEFWLNVLFSDNGIHQHFELLDITSLIDSDIQLERFLNERAQLEASGEYQLHRAIDDARIIWRSLIKASKEQ